SSIRRVSPWHGRLRARGACRTADASKAESLHVNGLRAGGLSLLDDGKVLGNLVGRKDASHLGHKRRQFLCEVRVGYRGIGEVEQLLSDQVVQRRLQPVSQPD